MKDETKPLIISVVGGSGAGKSFIIERIANELMPGQATVIQQDWYYKDLGHLPPEKRSGVNFDEPAALDSNLLIEHISKLKQNEAVRAPIYDYVEHIRRKMIRTVRPSRFIFIEGILILAIEEIRNLLDIKIFIECESELRYARRLRRDAAQRGRAKDSIRKQWEDTVLPMHFKYVEPFKKQADLITHNSQEGEETTPLEIWNFIRKQIGTTI